MVGRSRQLVAVVVVAVLAAPAVANAAPKAGPDHGDTAIRAYWTPKRMKEAKATALPEQARAVGLRGPDAVPGGEHAGGSTAGEGAPASTQAATQPVAAAVTAAAATTTYTDGWASGARYDVRVGKLYYRMASGINNVCSATVVARNLLLTAGHCVYTHTKAGVPVGWNTNFLFVPGKYGTSEPYGRFTGYKPAAFTSYYQGYAGQRPFFGQDYAFIKMYLRNGRAIGDVVGWAGVSWNNYTSYRSMGYPAEGFFDRNGGGTFPWFTDGPRIGSYQWGTSGYYDVRIGNRANGGASGGPWLVYGTGGPWANSVNSLCARQNTIDMFCTYMDGPFFTAQVKTLMDFAAAL